MLIFLAESDQDLRLGLQMLLHQEPGIHVVGLAIQAEGLLAQLEASRAEVLLLDWGFPGASILDTLFEIRGLESPPKIVVFSVNPRDRALALSSGVDAFISKSAPPDDLIKIILSLKEEV